MSRISTKKEEQVENPMEELRDIVENIDPFFGQSVWDRPAEVILNSDKGTVQQFIEALEQGLAGIKDHCKDWKDWGDEAEADKRGYLRSVDRMERILKEAKKLVKELKF